MFSAVHLPSIYKEDSLYFLYKSFLLVQQYSHTYISYKILVETPVNSTVTKYLTCNADQVLVGFSTYCITFLNLSLSTKYKMNSFIGAYPLRPSHHYLPSILPSFLPNFLSKSFFFPFSINFLPFLKISLDFKASFPTSLQQ